jgi:hypothetical protein
MTNNLGELKPAKALLAIVLGCTIAWLIFSRFSFQQEPAPTDKKAAIECNLKRTNDELDALRKRVEQLESSPPAPTKGPPKPSRTQKKRPKRS